MLDQPWPPPGPGPRQPRDAHARAWSDDLRRATPPRRPDAPGAPGIPGGAPAARRRVADERHHGGHDAWTPDARTPEPDAAAPAPAPATDRTAFPGARWLPQEEWIPDPTPAPEQRWTPEQDWVAAFAEPPGGAIEPVADVRGAGRRWGIAVAVLAPVVAVVAVVLALV